MKKERLWNIKWRIVFDASSIEGNSHFLHDVLEMGLKVFPEVLATLLRFRGNPVSVIGDIKQAYIQLSLDPRDRDLTSSFRHRIFKDDKGNRYSIHAVVTYRFTGLPFSPTCSPFLLSAILRELATMCREEYTNTAPT